MKKLLITTTTFPLHKDDTQPKFVYYLAKRLTDEFDVSVLAPRGKGGLDEEVVRRVYVKRYAYFFSRFETLIYGNGILENIRVNVFNALLIPFFLTAQFFNIKRVIVEQEIDIVNPHWILPQGLVAVIAKKIFNLDIKIIITSHGSDLFGLQRLNFLKRWVLNNSDSVIVVSNAMKKYCIEKLGVHSSLKIYVRSMGVDLRKKFVLKEKLEKRKNLIFVGRVVETKGLPVLLEAMNILHNENLDLKLTIVGGGNGLVNIRKIVKNLNLQNVVSILGETQNEEIPSLLNRHAIFILPSLQEGLGLVLIEAMGCGCAVVSSDISAIEDVVQHKENGLLFKSGDSLDLANNIRKLYLDNDLRIKYAKVGSRSVISKFDWTKVAKDYTNQLLK